MGLLTAAFLLWLVKSARNRFAKGRARLKNSFFGGGEEYEDSVMNSVKDHPGKQDRTSETKWADVCLSISIGEMSLTST
jgi:hypothetical protein